MEICKYRFKILCVPLTYNKTLLSKLVSKGLRIKSVGKLCSLYKILTITVSNPLEDLFQLISKLQSSIIVWEKEHPSQGVYTTFMDYCYCNQDQGQNYDRNFSFKAYNPIGVS